MVRYLLRRAWQTIPVLIGVSLIVFVITRVIPGDPVRLMFGDQPVSPEVEAAVRHDLGLDLPLPLQYLRYVGQLLRGDFGQSIAFREPVASLLLARLPATLELGITSLMLAVVVAIPAGILAAVHRGRLLDRVAMLVAVLGISVPSFWLGILLLVKLSVDLHWLPAFGRVDLGIQIRSITGSYVLDSLLTWNMEGLRSVLSHLVLPAVTLAVALQALMIRVLRASTVDALANDYVTAARARGLGERRVVLGHAVRNALLPTITIFGLRLGQVIGGAVVTETIFAWPGIGRLVVQSIAARDFLVVQGAVLVFALVYVVVNLFTDLVYAWADPRIRLG